MVKKLSIRTGLTKRNGGVDGHRTILVDIVRNVFRVNHYGDLSSSRIETGVYPINSDSLAIRQAEALLKRTSMLRLVTKCEYAF